jgi:glycosyltransferase involved in cell wall biosynthesis
MGMLDIIKTMRVLISTPYYLPNVSGITTYIQILAEELVKKGYKVEILTSQHLSYLKKEEVVNGVLIKRMWAPIKIGKGVIMPFFPLISINEIVKSDVVNCHLPQLESVWMSFWGKILGKKVILTHHTDLSFWKGIKNKITDGGVLVCQFLAGLMADKIVAYTDDYAKSSYFLKHFLNKTVSIYPPIKFENNITIIKSPNKIDEQIKNKKYIIGFCGRIAKQKGLEVLIKSTQFLDKNLGKNNYVILLAGPTQVVGENYFEYLQNKYGETIKNIFIFLGNIPRENLADFYKKIDLLVLPSDDRLESFGWVQIEAMMMGTPCVATNLPGMRVPILETGMGEIFENHNAEDLAQKIILVLKNGKKYYQKKSNNLADFDYQKTIRAYEQLLG